MRNFMLLVVVCLLSGCAATPKWDTTEKMMLGGVFVANAADGFTTSMAMSHGMTETNPIYGPYASDEELLMVKAASIGITALVADLMPSHGWRKIVLGIGIVPPALAAVNNYDQLRGPK